jgi:hypothetical protein
MAFNPIHVLCLCHVGPVVEHDWLLWLQGAVWLMSLLGSDLGDLGNRGKFCWFWTQVKVVNL